MWLLQVRYRKNRISFGKKISQNAINKFDILKRFIAWQEIVPCAVDYITWQPPGVALNS